MKYFIKNSQREGTFYHEFYKGHWDEKTFWSDNSIYLEDSHLCMDLVDAITAVVPYYDSFNTTEISANQWALIGQLIITKDEKTQAIYAEANEWLKEVFKEYDCFTILGI